MEYALLIFQENFKVPNSPNISNRNILQRYGLQLNIPKTEYMECSAKIESGTIRVNGNDLKKFDCFGYLGSKLLRQVMFFRKRMDATMLHR